MKGKGGKGGGNRNCRKGKPCGATCIAQKKICWVNLPGGKPGSNGGRNLHDSTTKVRDMLKTRQGGGPAPAAAPQPQSAPAVKTELSALEKAKAALKAQLAEDMKKTEEGNLSREQKIINKRQKDTKLTGEQAAAIRTYTSDRDIRGVNQYRNVNNCLRNPGACTNKEEADKLKGSLDSALAALPKNTDNFQFTRVIPMTQSTAQLADFLRNAKVGTTLRDPGYASYSSDKGVAEGLSKYGKSIKLVTRSGQIVPVNQYSNIKEEMEGILPRGSSLKIASITEDDNGITAILE